MKYRKMVGTQEKFFYRYNYSLLYIKKKNTEKTVKLLSDNLL